LEEESISTMLVEMGLHAYEAKAYAALLGGPLTAEEIVKRTKIPRAKIYGVLNDLMKLHLITLSEEKQPRKYEAVRSMSTLYGLAEAQLTEQRAQLEVREKKVNELIGLLGERIRTEEDRDAFAPARLERNTLALTTAGLLRRAKKSIEIMTKSGDWISDDVLRILEERCSQGVAVRVLLAETKAIRDRIKLARTESIAGILKELQTMKNFSIEVRRYPPKAFRMVIVDSSECNFIIWSVKKPTEEFNEDKDYWSAHYSRNPLLVGQFSAIFHLTWSLAGEETRTELSRIARKDPILETALHELGYNKST
jgi:sugar-specific transcriptional regulator TrmB